MAKLYLDSTEPDSHVVEVDPAPHGVDDRLWLLEDLLQHERVKRPLHDLLDLHLEGRDLAEIRTDSLILTISEQTTDWF